jgi:ubiquinone/menaquinone biosynthesis C-methylase UbiE
MSIFKIDENKIKYTDVSLIDDNYTDKMNAEYDWMAKIYDLFMFIFPSWKKWIKKVVPHIEGKKILEISFGSGYLMTQYSANNNYEIVGVDYNEKMVEITRKKLTSINTNINLIQGNVEDLPFSDNTFDTIINTMAFTGYPDGDKALSEMKRVLKTEGKLLLVDFDYPENKNIFGYYFVRLWESFGDIIKDMNCPLEKHNYGYPVASG